MESKHPYPKRKPGQELTEKEKREIVEITHKRLEERFGMIDLTGKDNTTTIIPLTKKQSELLKRKLKKK